MRVNNSVYMTGMRVENFATQLAPDLYTRPVFVLVPDPFSNNNSNESIDTYNCCYCEITIIVEYTCLL